MRSSQSTLREEQPIAEGRSVTFAIAPGLIARALFAVLALLVLAHLIFGINEEYLGVNFFGSTILWVLFDLQGEVTVPTWCSASLLLFCSGLFAAIALVLRRMKDQYQWHWLGLAIIFFGLSVDEAADFHGAVSYKIQFTYDTSGVLAYPWILPAAFLTVAVGIIYLPFLRQLPDPFRRQFVLAVGLFISGALVIEAIEAGYDSAVGGDDLAYILMVAVEETLEKSGIIVLATALLSYLGTIAGDVRFQIAPDEPTPT